jgi:hypothetical protein
MTGLAPCGPELGAANRRIIAERLGWPELAVGVCERIEAECPAWHVTWSSGGWMTWTQPGFYAECRGWHCCDPGPRYVYGATAGALREAVETAAVP